MIPPGWSTTSRTIGAGSNQPMRMGFARLMLCALVVRADFARSDERSSSSNLAEPCRCRCRCRRSARRPRQGCADAHADTPRRNDHRGIRGKARSPPRRASPAGALRDGGGRSRRPRTGENSRHGQRHPSHPRHARKPIASPGASRFPVDHLCPCGAEGTGIRTEVAGARKNALERGSSRCSLLSSRCSSRRDAGLVENAGVARLRQRASNENTVPLETVPRSKQCPNTEPRQDDGALHDSQRHGAALSHSATLSHGAAFPRTQPLHTAPLAALRSRLPPSRPYGCERPCRWC